MYGSDYEQFADSHIVETHVPRPGLTREQWLLVSQFFQTRDKLTLDQANDKADALQRYLELNLSTP